MMNNGVDGMTILDTVIVGAGQAGLGVSYYLHRDRRQQVVLERGRIGESWLAQRWDSFKLNTPNFMNALPGFPYKGPDPDGFWRQDELVHYFQQYVEYFQLPVRTGIMVVSVERAMDESHFIVTTRVDGQEEEFVLSRSVVIAAGIQHTPRIPPHHSLIPDTITQMHTASYRSAAELPPGAVVVANPLDEQMDPDLHERVLRDGLAAATVEGISGRDVTPFLLERFHTHTDGESLRANVRLVLRNAALAAEIAAA